MSFGGRFSNVFGPFILFKGGGALMRITPYSRQRGGGFDENHRKPLICYVFLKELTRHSLGEGGLGVRVLSIRNAYIAWVGVHTIRNRGGG